MNLRTLSGCSLALLATPVFADCPNDLSVGQLRAGTTIELVDPISCDLGNRSTVLLSLSGGECKSQDSASAFRSAKIQVENGSYLVADEKNSSPSKKRAVLKPFKCTIRRVGDRETKRLDIFNARHRLDLGQQSTVRETSSFRSEAQDLEIRELEYEARIQMDHFHTAVGDYYPELLSKKSPDAGSTDPDFRSPRPLKRKPLWDPKGETNYFASDVEEQKHLRALFAESEAKYAEGGKSARDKKLQSLGPYKNRKHLRDMEIQRERNWEISVVRNARAKSVPSIPEPHQGHFLNAPKTSEEAIGNIRSAWENLSKTLERLNALREGPEACPLARFGFDFGLDGGLLTGPLTLGSLRHNLGSAWKITPVCDLSTTKDSQTRSTHSEKKVPETSRTGSVPPVDAKNKNGQGSTPGR